MGTEIRVTYKNRSGNYHSQTKDFKGDTEKENKFIKDLTAKGCKITGIF